MEVLLIFHQLFFSPTNTTDNLHSVFKSAKWHKHIYNKVSLKSIGQSVE